MKITTTVTEDGGLTICISGRLTLDGCTAIGQIMEDARDRQYEIAIDLARVTLLDRPSVEYLAHLRSRSIALLNVPSYVKRWMEDLP